MKGKKSAQPKRAGALKKRPKKKPATHAIVFHYERGKETIRFRGQKTQFRPPVMKTCLPLTTNDAVDSMIASHPDPDTDADWMVVIVCDDTRAGRRAMIAFDDVVHMLGGKKRPHPRLWRFDLLEDAVWRAAATADVLQAGLLIVSATSKSNLPAAVQDWIGDWVQLRLIQNRRHAAALAALLGPMDDPDATDSPRIQFLKGAAETAGLGFVAPTAQAEASPASPAAHKPFTSDALLKTVAEVLPQAARFSYRPEIFFPERVAACNHWGLNE
jgi:hypothetical protein